MGRNCRSISIFLGRIPRVVDCKSRTGRVATGLSDNKGIQRGQHTESTRILEPVVVPRNTPRNTHRFLVERPVSIIGRTIGRLCSSASGIAPVREHAGTRSLHRGHVVIHGIKHASPVVVRVNHGEQAERHRREVTQVVDNRARGAVPHGSVARQEQQACLVDFVIPNSANDIQGIGKVCLVQRLVVHQHQRSRDIQVGICRAGIVDFVIVETERNPRSQIRGNR